MLVDFRADLHCHSTFSDGSDTPIELLNKAIEVGLKGLSITDHDTIEAYTPELFARAEELGIRLLPGIEISSEINDSVVHILGYGFDLHSQSFRCFLAEMQQRRAERNRALIKKLQERRISITEEELILTARKSEKKKTIGRPHIAELLVQKGIVSSQQEAFDRYLKEGAMCYVAGFKFTPLDAIQAIQQACGKAVLAHPHFLKRGRILRALLGLPFDGIECYYAHLPKELEAPWVQTAKEKGWMATGGSDYHGSFKPRISLGASWVGLATFERLLQSGDFSNPN